ncbi:SpoIIIAH-like family protein [Paenibacillus senegalensis]|uniref:SpoIIIAH-like family protein n=1 Tax=Paenibacillus senegalensis TaxID=1465766 RepID=UPI0002881D6A|nr:SpoIIIAH-like family protein [Paenibacillus senegalensis]
MNSKRQTIWLVSMLSLMVVLSAYYLFSEDVNQLDLNADGTVIEDINVSSEVIGHDHEGGAEAETGAGADTGAEETGAEAANELTPEDQEVISRLENQQHSTSEEYFAAMAIQRAEELYRQMDELRSITVNQEKSDEEIGSAYDQLQKLETTLAKLDHIEGVLSQSYSQAVVLEENDKWKVVVQADKLEKSEAVSIADLVMEEMNIGAEKLQIQVIQ